MRDALFDFLLYFAGFEDPVQWRKEAKTTWQRISFDRKAYFL